MEDDLEQNEAIAFSVLMTLNTTKINTDNGIILQKYINTGQMTEYLKYGYIVIQTKEFSDFGIVYFKNKSYVTFINNIELVRSMLSRKTNKKLFISPLFIDVAGVKVDIDVLIECYDLITNLFSILLKNDMKIFSSNIVNTRIGLVYISMKYTIDGLLLFESRIGKKKINKFIDFCNEF